VAYYLRYFSFIAWNWGIRLAFFTIYHEIRGERKYKINTAEIQDVGRITVKGNNLRHAEMYQGASYYLLEKVFAYMQKKNINHSIVDFGCGKGRAMVVAAAYGYKRVIGVDFASVLCEEAKRNIEKVKEAHASTQFEVIHEDVINYRIPSDVQTLFFFNPFNEIIMKEVMKNILSSVKDTPRQLHVIYLNPQHKEVFIKAGFKKIAGWRKLKYIEAEIYTL
jgi:predicted RNA methylase